MSVREVTSSSLICTVLSPLLYTVGSPVLGIVSRASVFPSVAFQPANSKASAPVAVYYPNTINTPPGTSMTLMTLDPTRGQMVPYGTGTVSNDGTQIVPDLDPAYPGKRYGLINFDWHGQMPPPPPGTNPNGGGGPSGGDPVDLSSGIEVHHETDIQIKGQRSPVRIVRTYRTGSTLAGPFGIGTDHNYNYRLDSTQPQTAQVVNLILPDANRIPFTRQANGTLVNLDAPYLRGVVMTTASNSTAEVRWPDGRVMRFVQGDILTGSVLVSMTDRNNNVTTIERENGRPARIPRIVDASGRALVFTYDSGCV